MEWYARYKRVRDTAWRTLLDFNVTSLPVSVNHIASLADIQVFEYGKLPNQYSYLKEGRSGFTLHNKSGWAVFYDPSTIASRRARFTVAHEFGHIFEGHELNDGLFVARDNTGEPNLETRDPEERAADMFAIRLLAPAIVLHELKLFTPEQIMEVCGIAYTAAAYRAERMKELEQRQKYGTHPLEQKVLEQFRPFILEYKKIH